MEMFFNSDEIRLHIKSVHSMSSNAYIDRFERLESKPAEIHCFLCDHEMKRNIFAINKHLEACHDMDVLKYGRKFKLRQHEITFQQYEGQEVKKKQPEIKKIAQSVVSPPLERKRIRPCPASKKSSSSDVQSPEDPLPPKKSRISTTSKKWYHGTEYKCQICLEVHYSSSALISHLTASHEMDSQVYRIKYGRFATMTVYYSCKICGNGVIHLQDTIARYKSNVNTFLFNSSVSF